MEPSDNRLYDSNLGVKLVENSSFYKPVTIEEIVIFTISPDVNAFHCLCFW